MPKVADAINPAHYKAGTLGIEAITVVENAMAPSEFRGYLLGSIYKYLLRAGHKTPEHATDLKKARWFLDRLIAVWEKEEEEDA